MKAKVIIHGSLRTFQREIEAPMNLSAVINDGTPILEHPCGGQGKCGKCRVKAVGKLSPVSQREQAFLSGSEIFEGIRLACLTEARGDIEIWLNENKQEKILTQFVMPELSGTPWEDGLGMAVDIGTTTVVAYLYDLKTKEALSVASCPNPQRAMGADVVSRIKASLDGQARELKKQITVALRSLCQELLDKVGMGAEQLTAAVVTGNTAMLYFLTEQDVHSIAYVPFIPSSTFGYHLSGDAIGLPAHVKAWLPDCVAAYVGADITCAMLYAGFFQEGQCRKGAPVLLADIGTNGEMALSANGKIYTCSTAAGPAFEGAGISQGMTAHEGAISRVDFDGDALTYQVIGDGDAKGICGSGLVDAVAALLKAGAIDETGRFQMDAHPLEAYMSKRDNEICFTFPGSCVSVTQGDIRAVQSAKAAICAGVLVLMEEAGVEAAQVKELLIAGGFGSGIRPESAEMIGLIPPGLAKRTKAIGNAAGAGAAMMLLSKEALQLGTVLAKTCEIVELSTHSSFSDAFIDCMAFE